MDPQERSTQRRRSERVAQSLPIVIRGVDLLGQPFEERTATLSFNLHGCRYASRHHLPKNTWVTLEAATGSESRNVRARVAWIQRPHSVREFFQVAVELEMPVNVWAFQPAPLDWTPMESVASISDDPTFSQRDVRSESEREEFVQHNFGIPGEEAMSDVNERTSVSESGAPSEVDASAVAENPLLRELSAQLGERARHAVDEAAAQAAARIRKEADEVEEKRTWLSEESFRKWKEEFEHAQEGARERLAAQHNELVGGMKVEFEQNLGEARRLIEEIEKTRAALRAENDAAVEAAAHMAHARAQVETAHASLPNLEVAFSDKVTGTWRDHLNAEMTAAQTQWNELLQSSLDSGVKRIAEQLSERSQDIARQAEGEISAKFERSREPLLKAVGEADEMVRKIGSTLDGELARAKSSLAEIEASAGRLNELAGQVDASSRNAVDDLNRRLQAILDAQTQEMGERAEALTRDKSEKAAADLDSLREKVVQDTAAEIEAKIAPHLERIPQILRGLSSRELQMEEGLRLHRERLRQVSESSEREIVAHLGLASSEARKDFEVARQEALAKWNEDLDANAVRASRNAAETMEKSSEAFAQEARARLQTLVEETVTAAGARLEEKSVEARHGFANALEAESFAHVQRIREQLEGASAELTHAGRTQIEQAAEVTAAAFGQVLRGISDQEVEHFLQASVAVLESRTQDLENSATQLLRKFETSGESSLARFHTQMASHLETSIAEGRSALASEFNSVLSGYRAERDAHQKDWVENLERMNSETAGRYQERLDTACDSWVVSSVRRLNEHGQNIIESLMRSADQALRDSCARFFDGLAETLRDRSVGFGASPHSSNAHEAAEAAAPPPPVTEAELNHPSL